MLTILLPTLLGAGLTIIGHIIGARSAAAKSGTDAFAGMPGLPGHPILNAIGGAAAPAQPTPPVVVPAAPAAPSLLLSSLSPLLSTMLPLVEQEVAALLAATVKTALTNATAQPAATTK